MIADALLALGLILSIASQLRPAGMPIGPGEACLVVWIALMLSGTRKLLHSRLTPALSRMLVFWGLFSIALCLGTMTAYATGDIHDPDLFIHDAMAYPLLAAVSFLSTVEPRVGCRIHRAAWFLILFSIVFYGVQLASGWDLIAIPQTDPWYWDRFRGLSDNPNQLAIFCAVLTFLPLHFVEYTAGIGGKAVAILCTALSIYVGRLTKSDTFGLVLVTGFALFAALKLRSWLLTPRRRPTFRAAAAGVIVVMLPVIIATGLLFANLIEVEARDLAEDMAKGTSQETAQTANIRFHSWSRAIDRGIESGMLGLGPGPHLEIPPALVAARRDTIEPKYVEHPHANTAPNFEAHNTFLDLFTQGGLIAVLSFTGLITTTWLLTYLVRLEALTVMLWGIILLCVFHLIIRHPVIWFAIAFALVAANEARGRSPALKQGN